MPPFGPISRRRLIQALRQLGFEGPFPGGRHEFMVKGPPGRERRLSLPNPHQGEIGKNLLARILQQGGITRDEWERT